MWIYSWLGVPLLQLKKFFWTSSYFSFFNSTTTQFVATSQIASQIQLNQIDTIFSTSPPPLQIFFAIMFQTVFSPAIKASTPSGGTYRQLLNTDVQTRLWKYEIDTIVVTKHNRRRLWRGKRFEYWISLQKKVAQNEPNHWRCWIGVR